MTGKRFPHDGFLSGDSTGKLTIWLVMWNVDVFPYLFKLLFWTKLLHEPSCCHFDNFLYSQCWIFFQNDNISMLVHEQFNDFAQWIFHVLSHSSKSRAIFLSKEVDLKICTSITTSQIWHVECHSCHCYQITNRFRVLYCHCPAETQRKNNVIMTSKRRHDVVLAS